MKIPKTTIASRLDDVERCVWGQRRRTMNEGTEVVQYVGNERMDGRMTRRKLMFGTLSRPDRRRLTANQRHFSRGMGVQYDAYFWSILNASIYFLS